VAQRDQELEADRVKYKDELDQRTEIIKENNKVTINNVEAAMTTKIKTIDASNTAALLKLKEEHKQ
jgi:hypothetical protein